jgi:predicted GNAT family N-acyltransferase
LTTTKTHFIVEPLDKSHNKAVFSCGVDALDSYLKTKASQDDKRDTTRPFVLVDTRSNEIAGFYTLSSSTVLLKGLPEKTQKKLPRHPDVPAVLLGRLAISTSYKGQKLGAFLLVHALEKAYNASKEIAITFFIVDAKDEQAKAFYQHFGFVSLEDDDLRLYLPMKTISKMFE